jgi:hypothetical protein
VKNRDKVVEQKVMKRSGGEWIKAVENKLVIGYEQY